MHRSMSEILSQEAVTEPGRIVTYLWKLIIQVSVVLRKTVGGSD